jgi:hypothetical protein
MEIFARSQAGKDEQTISESNFLHFDKGGQVDREDVEGEMNRWMDRINQDRIGGRRLDCIEDCRISGRTGGLQVKCRFGFVCVGCQVN